MFITRDELGKPVERTVLVANQTCRLEPGKERDLTSFFWMPDENFGPIGFSRTNAKLASSVSQKKLLRNTCSQLYSQTVQKRVLDSTVSQTQRM